MSNAFVHVELNTQNVDAAKAFYGELFAWGLEDMPMGDGTYTCNSSVEFANWY